MVLSRLTRMLRRGFAKPDHQWREEDAEPSRPVSVVDDPWDPMPKPAPVAASVLTVPIAPPSDPVSSPAPTQLAFSLEAPPGPPAALRQTMLPLGFVTTAKPVPSDETLIPASVPTGPAGDEPLPIKAIAPVPVEAANTAREDWSFDLEWSNAEPAQATDTSDPASDLPSDIDLPEFNAQARQEIWEKPLSDPPLAAFVNYPEIQAALKADRILRHLWLPTRQDRDAYLNWLITVFFTFRPLRASRHWSAWPSTDASTLRSFGTWLH
jgi:hypothetical protein